jgi:hypothetical protein
MRTHSRRTETPFVNRPRGVSVFHLLSLAWRHAGVNAVPLMRNPMRATSLGEFWLGDNGDALNVVFAYLPIVYGLAASQPEFNVRF